MKQSRALAILCVILAVTKALAEPSYVQYIKDYPQSMWIGTIYDAFRSNNFATMSMMLEGFSMFPAIKFEGTEEGTLAHYVRGINEVRCDLAVQTEMIFNGEYYRKTTKESVNGKAGLDLGIVSFGGGASNERTKAEETLKEGKNMMTLSKVECFAYDVKMIETPADAITEELLRLLSTVVDDKSALGVVRKYGTSIIVSMAIGTRVVQEHVFTYDKYRSMTAKGSDFKANADFSLMHVFSIGGGGGNGEDSNTTKLWEKEASSTSILSVGSYPPATLDAAGLKEWVESSRTTGAPAQIEAIPLADYIDSLNMTIKTVDGKSTHTSVIAACFRRAYRSYCVETPGCELEKITPYWNSLSFSTHQGQSIPPSVAAYTYVFDIPSLMRISINADNEMVLGGSGLPLAYVDAKTSKATTTCPGVVTSGYVVLMHDSSVITLTDGYKVCKFPNKTCVPEYCVDYKMAIKGGSVSDDRKFAHAYGNQLIIFTPSGIYATDTLAHGAMLWDAPITVKNPTSYEVVVGSNGVLSVLDLISHTMTSYNIASGQPVLLHTIWFGDYSNSTSIQALSAYDNSIVTYNCEPAGCFARAYDSLYGIHRHTFSNARVLAFSAGNIMYMHLTTDPLTVYAVSGTTVVALGACKLRGPALSCAVGADESLYCATPNTIESFASVMYLPNKTMPTATWIHTHNLNVTFADIAIGESTLIVAAGKSNTATVFGFVDYIAA